jgi:uncharacterized protein YdeI (YjbR/CyaY-like superfamily)
MGHSLLYFPGKECGGHQSVKDFCALGFFKGVLLQDAHGILSSPGENVQAVRLARFTDVRQVHELQDLLKAYIFEAVEVEKARLKVKLKKTSDYEIPAELQQKLDTISDFKAAFEALTPGRQRGYILYFAQPKQSKTREARIIKYMPLIFQGKGLNDDRK